MAFVTDSNGPQPLWQPPPTACLTTPGAASEAPSPLMHPPPPWCFCCSCASTCFEGFLAQIKWYLRCIGRSDKAWAGREHPLGHQQQGFRTRTSPCHPCSLRPASAVLWDRPPSACHPQNWGSPRGQRCTAAWGGGSIGCRPPAPSSVPYLIHMAGEGGGFASLACHA